MTTNAASSARQTGGLRRATFVFGVVLLSACVLSAIGLTYEAIASARDEKRFAAPGKLIETGSNRLYFQCLGSGSPTVILESGLGVPSLGWSLVTPRVSEFTRVCVYDRAGYGYSDPPTSFPRTSAIEAAELHALLKGARIEPPYILVGHSLGGHIVRVYAGAYPHEVSGMVLVDAAHEDMTTRLPRSIRHSLRRQSRLLRLAAWASRLGVLRLWPSLAGFDERSPALRNVPPETLKALVFLTLQPKTLRAAASEAQSLEESGVQARDGGSLGDRPLAVLVSGRVGGMTPADTEEYRQVWIGELQPRLSRLSTQGSLTVVENSGHMIPLERPDAVVDAIRSVVQSARHDVSR